MDPEAIALVVLGLKTAFYEVATLFVLWGKL